MVFFYAIFLQVAHSTAVSAECVVDNFDDRDAEGWLHCGEWSENQQPQWDASTGSYCLGLEGPVRAPPPPPLSIASEWELAGTDSRYANGCLRLSFKTGTVADGTWNSHHVVSIRADCRHGGYRAMLGPSLGRISIFRRYGLLADEVGHAFTQGTHYRTEFCAEDTQLTLKYWPLGDTEPETPQLNAQDKVYSKGNVGVGVFLDNDNRGPILNACYDDIRFVPSSHCRGDVDCNGVVDIDDLRAVASSFGSYEPCQPRRLEDFDQDCAVGFADVLTVVKGWGDCQALGGK